MSSLPLRIAPDPILRQKAKKISSFSPSLQRMIDDMIETMHDNHGVGLAANQIGVLQRVVVIQLPEDPEPRIFINPEIVKAEGEREVPEGCLSIPGYRGLVKRSERVRAKGLDRNGKPIKVTGDEMLAQALEHEIDHLNGILYIDRLVDSDKLWKENELDDEEESDEDADAEDLQEAAAQTTYAA